MSCASTQVLHCADCSVAEIPSDKFLHFTMDCCFLEVRASLAECSPESATGMSPPVGHPRWAVERLKKHSPQMQKFVREFLTTFQRHREAHCAQCTEYLQSLAQNIMPYFEIKLYELHAKLPYKIVSQLPDIDIQKEPLPRLLVSGDGGIRTREPRRANAFRVRPVMTTSIRLQYVSNTCLV